MEGCAVDVVDVVAVVVTAVVADVAESSEYGLARTEMIWRRWL